ncbi:WG repeat-containing protein [Spirosoma panaciterrae]|uniref:WG repeat-containing protein n=1 Tax=Spirosoma panaciterrae TaxID=496058 RepID=UPI00036DFFCE|nr:WG repeat-containing protein [Spirosoma panaciterrae]
MTESELIDRLREAIVLDGPDVWRTNGYLQDAQRAGLSLADAQKRATDISQDVANNSLLFQNIQARIARMAQPSRSQFYDQDLAQIVNAATSLKLSPDFVKNRWVPTVLKRLAPPPDPTPKPTEQPVPSPPVTSAPPVVPNEFDRLINREPVVIEPKVIDPEPIRSTLSAPVVNTPVPPAPVVVDPPVYQAPSVPTEPAPIVRAFTATPARIRQGQTVTLEWEVENLLAVTIDDLGEGLSPKNRGWVKPSKSTDYTLFDANDNPLSTVRVEVIPRDRSGIYGVLFALLLLALIYWFIKSSNSRPDEPRPKSKTERSTSSIPNDRSTETRSYSDVSEPEKEATSTEATAPPTESPEEQTVAANQETKADTRPKAKPTDADMNPPEPESQPATPADARQGKYEESFGDKPFDKVELGADERGWRRARSHGRWGYINADDEWVIKPEYEAVTPFRGNTASVFLNGQLLTINRNGEQIRN